ncbi:murein biosynthesis integral membrane protein MurJ [Candidatus Roizmanbacteria bacterium CG22_combo_CG10-13_8_21_14_all_38_20]|uniref:Probable lipid II flippase MurJ n=1 Tax=Candidatus Roizmanbacteria bacterium CG22_combo_CG10-13_8_21_14_all_38_20 TaxID=1974862 RepID=A0A2H0BYJ3_9BACT|nr:murein biosynthesis integral membrane protein MurJ [Candidatus Microgenomates bacterium]PIP62008.1 MAG: murein biosynthesis integral membrane protein MurJ [Candidatus Roizmanbacteria bacterium CG22_combo_CG10-13_8_21_14_all_38_20]PJC31333.1 MAG: murein biosynthesis integral membrane protein MurJ [Candidatus Roizmanbacteria bacterium CG_4_9_14_0_2_um_filter_38_17]
MLQKVVSTVRSLVSRKQTNILSAAAIIMATVFASRTLGLVRDRLLSGRFTADELGVYFASFRVPSLIFEVLVIGTVSTAFIPVFSKYLTTHRKKEAFHIASSVINLASLMLLILLIPLLIFTKPITQALAPGFSEPEVEQMMFFTRVLLVAQVLPLLFGNFMTAILQSYKHFLLPAFAPIVYNLGTILGIIFFSPYLGLFGVVLGVVLGAVFFLAIQIPQITSLGYKHIFSFDFHNLGVRKIFKLAGPRTLSLGIAQIDSTIDLVLASLIGASSITVFTFAQHLQQVPVGLFGLAIAQATLPTLSQSRNSSKFKEIFLASWHQVLFLVLPVSAILVILRIPAVRLVFGADLFDWDATVLTGMTLSFFAVSLFAQASVHLLIRAFFSLQNSKIPVTTSTIAVLINSGLSIYFIQVLHLPIWSLGLSASIGAVVNFTLLIYLLNKKVKSFNKYQLFVPPLKMAIATFAMIIFLQIPKKLLDQLVFDTTRTLELFLFTITVALIGLLAYAFMSWILNIKEVLTYYDLLKRVIKVRDLVIDTGTEVSGEDTP